MIKKQLSSLKRSRRFISYREAKAFAHHLDNLRIDIKTEMFKSSPKEAFDCMLKFLDLHTTVLNRVDDSNGYIGTIFKESCSDLGKIAEQTLTPKKAVNIVYKLFMQNDYGIYDYIIANFKSALKEAGLTLLHDRFLKNINDKNQSITKSGLKDIADCQEKIEAYIKACSLFDEPKTYECLEIAERLINQSKSEDALFWIKKAEMPDNDFHQERISTLKIKALELKGDCKNIFNERIAFFSRELRSDVYEDLLNNINPKEKEDFINYATKTAFDHHDINLSISFLFEAEMFQALAEFIFQKIDKIDGEQYYLLRPVANNLAVLEPLPATLLYRKMIDAVLKKSIAKYYTYAVKDILMCKTLSLKINDWKEHKNHNQFFEELKEKHKLKTSLWEKYEKAIPLKNR